MTSLCITVPEDMATAANEVAKFLGVSRTEFIRQAIAQELNNFKRKTEELKVIKSLEALKQSKPYFKESEIIMESLFLDLPEEKDEWWNK